MPLFPLPDMGLIMGSGISMYGHKRDKMELLYMTHIAATTLVRLTQYVHIWAFPHIDGLNRDSISVVSITGQHLAGVRSIYGDLGEDAIVSIYAYPGYDNQQS